MLGLNPTPVARDARAIYDALEESLEASHTNQFVAIEPVSGEFFLGSTLSDAIGSSRKAHPALLAHAFRIAHKAAVHFGTHLR